MSRRRLPPGPFSGGDIFSYRELILTVPRDGQVVELGSYLGRSICSVAEQLITRKVTVTCVDLFVGCPTTKLEGDTGGTAKGQLLTNLKEFDLVDRVTVYVKDTVKAAEIFDDRSLDLVFIDADHSYAAVFRDLTAWWPKVRNGGMIAGHDYKRAGKYGHEDVRRALHEFFDPDVIRKNLRQPQTVVWHVVKFNDAEAERRDG